MAKLAQSLITQLLKAEPKTVALKLNCKIKTLFIFLSEKALHFGALFYFRAILMKFL